MSAADLPLAALRLHPQTERALLCRGVVTAGQLAALTPTELRKTCSESAVKTVRAALAERGLSLRPGRTYVRRQAAPAAKPAPAAAAPKPAKPAAPAAPPAAAAPAAAKPAPAIPPLPKIGRVQVRAAAQQQPRTCPTPAAPTAPLQALRSVAAKARSAVGSALIRLGERLAPR